MKTKRLLLYILITLLISFKVNGQELITVDNSMVLIPSGSFLMGKNSDKGRDFSPAHKVSVNSFYMDKYEVTNREYLLFCTKTGHKYPEFWNTDFFKSGKDFLDYPVIGVNWWDAQKYAKWAGKRLPTEAEWEYAARGGLVDNDFPNGNKWRKEKAKQDSIGWRNLITPVGKYEPNGYGLFDMGGNVWEWIADKYAEDYYKTSPVYNPTVPSERNNPVIRGGSWHSGSMCKKVYYRKGLPSNWNDFAVGFRCVKDNK